MGKFRRFVFLSNDFYNNYPHSLYPEIEQKSTRPYIQVMVLINNVQFAVPLRSNITHPHVLWTDKKNRCGVDFSKAVVITKPNYVDSTKIPHIRQKEFDALRGKDYRIKSKMEKYIEKYKNAKKRLDLDINKELCSKSTLQYFEQYI